MVTSLLEHERIETTDAKAKELRRLADRMITLGKQGTLHARRRARGVRASRDVVQKLFDELAPRFRDAPGGYTRIVKLGMRAGDAAPVSMIELVDRAGQRAREPARRRSRRAARPAQDAAARPRDRGRKRAAAG